MLLARQERSSSRKRTGLNRWKQLSRKPSPKPFDPDNMEHWIKRVEKASEYAVLKAFSAGNSDFSRRLWGQIVDLETSEQIEDHDEVYAEAQELVNDWLDTKLKQELASDGDAEDTVSSIPPVSEASGHLKYDNFDDLCSYLEDEEESTTIQKFIDHLLHKDVVDSGMLEDLGMNGNQDQKQQKDPRLTMEMRHKQVKENRLRREKELERQRIEKTLKKSIFLEAQYLVQEEKKRKALEAKKEEEEIQREMVKLRREIIERRRTVEEAWKTEKKKQEENSPKIPERVMFQSVPILLDEEKMAKERKKKLKELLIQTFKENHQCQKRYFSAWHKLILDDRIKLGKAGTLSDWKLQLKVLKAWRDYTRSQKLERETRAMENNLREENSSPVASPPTEGSRSDSRNSLSGPRRNPRRLMAPHPILKAMEERAVQRAERRQILAERKKKQEEEKLAQLKAQEEERQKREAEEKEAQRERKREEKRLKKMKELEKQKRIQRNQQLEAIAKNHYESVLLRKKGLEPWKRLRMQSKQNIQVAEEHHSLALQRKCLLTWFQCSRESLARKAAQADQLYSQTLLRRVTRSWLQYLTDLEEAVRKQYVHFLQKKIFRAWFNMVREAKVDSQSKHKTAVEHSDRRILWVTFQTWKKFAKFMKEERVREERREQLRKKVAEILPDFQVLAPL
ncbi:coiled-coil domain-containing protein 191 isoform 3-T4 [Hipposideros larvatus]